MANSFWEKLEKPFFALAPMADVSDWPFRQIVAKCGRPDIFYTEFVSADGLCSEKGRVRLLPLLHHTSDESPIVAQIFGANPENIFKTAKLVRRLGFDGLDINMGCPDKKVVKQGAGIALSKTPELAKEIISAAKDGADSLPISIKTRLGYSTIDMKWLEMLLDAKVSALAVHLRTMKEMSKVPAHWEIVKEIAEMSHSHDTLLIANGDVVSREEGLQKARETGTDGIMVGRGIFHNPWIFLPEKLQMTVEDEKQERLQLLIRHVELFTEFWSRPPFSPEKMGRTFDPPASVPPHSTLGRNFDVLKKFIKMYVARWDGAGELRAKLMQAKNKEEILGLIEK